MDSTTSDLIGNIGIWHILAPWNSMFLYVSMRSPTSVLSFSEQKIDRGRHRCKRTTDFAGTTCSIYAACHLCICLFSSKWDNLPIKRNLQWPHKVLKCGHPLDISWFINTSEYSVNYSPLQGGSVDAFDSQVEPKQFKMTSNMPSSENYDLGSSQRPGMLRGSLVRE